MYANQKTFLPVNLFYKLWAFLGLMEDTRNLHFIYENLPNQILKTNAIAINIPDSDLIILDGEIKIELMLLNYRYYFYYWFWTCFLISINLIATNLYLFALAIIIFHPYVPLFKEKLINLNLFFKKIMD